MVSGVGNFSSLKKTIESKEAKVGVIGLGYVGLPIAVSIASAGFEVTGVDIDDGKISEIHSGNSYVEDVSNAELNEVVENGKLKATSSYKKMDEMDVINICVSTPLNKNKEPELEALKGVLSQLSKHRSKGTIYILQSTTFPGTTSEVALPKIETDDFKVGKEFFLAFSPERIDPGNEEHGFEDIPKVVGGITERGTELASSFFDQVVTNTHPVSSPEAAEMSKLLENIFRNVNIALVNELRELGERMGIDIREVIDAAATKPFGFMPFSPGPGVGGHCIPVDPFYLTWKAREYDFYTNFINLAAETNDNVPYYLVDRIEKILNNRGLSLIDSQVLILGVTFKSDVSDTRNSPAIKIAKLLEERKADIQYYDPYVKQISEGDLTLTSLGSDNVKHSEADVTLILVDHDKVNLSEALPGSELIIDLCGATKNRDDLPGEEVVSL